MDDTRKDSTPSESIRPIYPIGRTIVFDARAATVRPRHRPLHRESRCLALCYALALTGCNATAGRIAERISPPLTIGDASAPDGVNDTHGRFTGLKHVLQEALDRDPNSPKPKRIELVVMHGMSDHCPGYALDESNGWLSKHVTEQIFHLEVAPESKVPALYSFAGPDNASKLYLGLKTYRYYGDPSPKRDPDHYVQVEVVEVTYSGLFHVLKTAQLQFDFTKKPDTKAQPTVGDFSNDQVDAMDASAICIDPVFEHLQYFSQSRVSLNLFLKEDLMDRYLADVVLYIGSYGQALNDAIAEALCRITSTRARGKDGKPGYQTNAQQPEQRCLWSVDHENASDMQLVFMTHSLGGRVIYDTLFQLVGCNVRNGAGAECARDHQALPGDSGAAEAYVEQVLQHRLALYMFANQIPLLGLAYIPPQTDPTDTARSYALMVGQPTSVPLVPPADEPTFSAKGPFARLKEISRRPSASTRKTLTGDGQMDFVAFSDANDLFTYPVPGFYAHDIADGNSIRIANVYGVNSLQWFGVLENPAEAHANYMLIDRTWNAVWCGANAGAVLQNPCGSQPAQHP